jgi:hypothetical protein
MKKNNFKPKFFAVKQGNSIVIFNNKEAMMLKRWLSQFDDGCDLELTVDKKEKNKNIRTGRRIN